MSARRNRQSTINQSTIIALFLCLAPASNLVGADSALDIVREAEARRIEMIARVSPAVVAIYDSMQRGGGSGVIIDRLGYGITNYHVLAGMLDKRRGWGGLQDGKLYDLEVLGIDPIGDVAMFRLFGREDFPCAGLGDSDAVNVGDAILAMGNPFVLSEDHSPAVTLGLVTGVHRYQWGTAGNLIYSDCIQVDAAINPGNSGGPLFNEAGEIIGINGRISVNTRGRFNVGFGYAITSNQIRRFVPALRAGLLGRHGTLQATVEDADSGVRFAQVVPRGAADVAGVRTGDRLVAVDGVAITSANHFASLLGTYPGDWNVLLALEREGEPHEAVARLDAVTPKLQTPFVVDREVNLEQVRRVLSAFQKAVMAEPAAGRPQRWQWTVRREYTPVNGTMRKLECFEASQYDDGPIRLEQHGEEATMGRLIEFNERYATHRTRGSSGESYDLPADARMVLSALYVLHHRLLLPLEELDLTEIAQAGGDRLVRANAVRSCGEPALTAGVELIDWPLADGALATFAFSVESGEVVRVDVRDIPSGVRATIYPEEYREIGDVRRPCALEVLGLNSAYRETWTDWEEVH